MIDLGRRVLAVLLACFVVVGPGAVGSAGEDLWQPWWYAQDVKSDLLPLDTFGDIVVDDEHRRVYVTGGPSADRLLVLDFNGEVVREVGNLAGASGMLLEDDHLYVTLYNSNRIVRLARDTLDKVDTYVIGDIGGYQVVRAGSLLWVVTGDCYDENGLYWIDTDTGESGQTSFPENNQRPGQPSCTRIAGSDVTDDFFWVDGDWNAVVKAEAQGTELEAVAEHEWQGGLHLDLSQDADHLYVGGGHAVYRTDTFALVESYAAGRGLAVPADENHVVIDRSNYVDDDDPDLVVYEEGSSQPQLKMNLIDDEEGLLDTVALTGDETRAFLVTNDPYFDHIRFWVVREPLQPPSFTTIDDPPEYPHRPGDPLSLGGTVTDPLGGEPVQGVRVNIFMDRRNDHRRKIASLRTDANGHYEFQHRPRSETTYRAVVPRSSPYRTSAAEAQPVIMRVEPPTHIDLFARGPVDPGQRFELRGELADTWYGSRNRDVNLYKKVDGKKRWLFRRLRFSPDEREFLITTSLRRKTTFIAEWPGEPGFEPVSGRWTVRVNPR